MGSLFGGGGSKTTSTNGYNMLPANMQGLIQQYLTQATGISNAPYTPYTGQQVAPLSGLENQATNLATANVGQAENTIQGANNLNNQLATTAAQGPTLENIQQYINPYQQGVTDQVKDAAIHDYQTTTLPQINHAAASQGAFGGSRQAVLQSEATNNLNKNLANIQQQGQAAGYTNAQNTYFNALNTSSDLAKNTAQTALYGQQAVGSDVNLLNQQGANERQVTQAGLSNDYSNFENQQNYPTNALNILGGALGNVNPYFAPVGQTSGGGGSSSLGTIAGLGMTAAMMFSDERLKDNKKKVGKLDNGLDVYSYNYKGSPQTTIGVMAQDVEKKNPSAVGQTKSGIKLVDYAKAVDKKSSKKKGYAAGGPVRGYANGGDVQWDPQSYDPNSGITWDAPSTVSGGSGDWLSSLKKLAFGDNGQGGVAQMGTSALSKAYGQAAEDAQLQQKQQLDTINKAGSNVASAKFTPLYSPYQTEQSMANTLLQQSMNNLFAEGGPVDSGDGSDPYSNYIKYQKEHQFDLNKNVDSSGPLFSTASKQAGNVLDFLTKPANPFYRQLTPDQIAQAQIELNPPAPQPQASAPVAVPSSPQMGSTNKTQEQVAQMLGSSGLPTAQSVVGGPTPSALPTGYGALPTSNNTDNSGMDMSINPGQVSDQNASNPQNLPSQAPTIYGMTPGGKTDTTDQGNSIVALMQKLGLDKTQTKPQQRENPLLALLGTLGAYSGSGVPSAVARNRALAAATGANQDNVDVAQKQDSEDIDRKIKAVTAAAQISQLQNQEDWKRYQQALMTYKVTRPEGEDTAEKKQLDIQKARLELQKQQNELDQEAQFSGNTTKRKGNYLNPQTGKVEAYK